MAFADGTEITAQELPTNKYTINKDGITATKEFLVTGPPLEDGTGEEGPVLGNTLLDVASADGVPKVGEEYAIGTTSPVCVSVEVEEVEGQGTALFKMYKVICNYELTITNDSLPFIEWDGSYTVANTAERYYFETQQETIHLDSSKEFKSYGEGLETPMIGVDDAGNVNGVDIQGFSPVLVVESFFPLSTFNFTEIQNALGKTNLEAFYGRAPGECFFSGIQELGRSLPVTIDGGTEQVIKMQFRFLISKNIPGAELPTFDNEGPSSFIITDGKGGWEYLWVKNGVSGADDKIKTFTELAQVHEVYEAVNLTTTLGISGSL